jgi:hypothetical protein
MNALTLTTIDGTELEFQCAECAGYFEAGKDECRSCGMDLTVYNNPEEEEEEECCNCWEFADCECKCECHDDDHCEMCHIKTTEETGREWTDYNGTDILYCDECYDRMTARQKEKEEKELKEYLVSNNNNEMTEITYTTGTVNKASMDKYELEGQRLLLFGLNSKETDEFTTDTFIQLNYVADKKLWLCCWYVSGKKADISIMNDDEVKTKVQEILRKWNWEENKQYWKMINGETIVCDDWNIGYDGEEMVEEVDTEVLCASIRHHLKDDPDGEFKKEFLQIVREMREELCGDCGNNKEPDGKCFDCEIRNNPYNGLFTPESYEIRQSFGTLVNATFEVCMEKNREKVLY